MSRKSFGKEIDKRLLAAAKESAERIEQSEIFMALFNDAMRSDPVCLMQIGLAIYMDKPIFVLVPEGTEIPNNLLSVARRIEYFKGDAKDMTSIKQATDRLLRDYKEPDNKTSG